VARRNAGLAENSWYAPELLEPLKKNPFVRFDLSLRDTLLRSMFKEPLPLYLRVEDRNAMAWSVESRVPFLDYRLVELALAADCRQLLDGPYNKRLLREGMAGRIPESVRLRVDKMGFPTPARQWLSGELFESVCDLVTSRALVDSGIVEMPKIRRDLDRFRRGEADLSMPLFRLSQFGIWLEKPTPRQRGAAPRKVSDGVPVLGQAMNR